MVDAQKISHGFDQRLLSQGLAQQDRGLHRSGNALPAEISRCAGNLSSRAGILLLAGLYGAALLKDGGWQVVFHHAAMAERSRRESPAA